MLLAESLFRWYMGLSIAFALIVVVNAAGAVAANTSHLDALMVTNDAVAELKEEALRHAALVEAL